MSPILIFFSLTIFSFDDMETADWEPDRQTVSVRMRRCDATGRLGVKISHTPSGIYVDSVDKLPQQQQLDKQQQQLLCRGDRLLAVNGRSIEHLGKKAVNRNKKKFW